MSKVTVGTGTAAILVVSHLTVCSIFEILAYFLALMVSTSPYLPLGVVPAHICRRCSFKPCHCYVNVAGTQWQAACHHDFMAIDLTLH